MWDVASTLQRGDCGSGTVGGTGQQERHWQVAAHCSQSSNVLREQIFSALTTPENVVSSCQRAARPFSAQPDKRGCVPRWISSFFSSSRVHPVTHCTASSWNARWKKVPQGNPKSVICRTILFSQIPGALCGVDARGWERAPSLQPC